jgi:hypothetical protein
MSSTIFKTLATDMPLILCFHHNALIASQFLSIYKNGALKFENNSWKQENLKAGSICIPKLLQNLSSKNWFQTFLIDLNSQGVY